MIDRGLALDHPGGYWRLKRYGTLADPTISNGFKCRSCQAYVHSIPSISGVQNRNHCPYCLHSRHMDLHHPGDRLSACKAIMQPIGLTMKLSRGRYTNLQLGKQLTAQPGEPLASQSGEPLASQSGELMVVHCCSECGGISINRIAADDMPDVLAGLLECTDLLDTELRLTLVQEGIHLLEINDEPVVMRQLYGNLGK